MVCVEVALKDIELYKHTLHDIKNYNRGREANLAKNLLSYLSRATDTVILTDSEYLFLSTLPSY